MGHSPHGSEMINGYPFLIGFKKESDSKPKSNTGEK
jgi:hypothetical protein